jgi:hypothetical protein
MARTWLLLSPTVATCRMTLDDRCYCRVRVTRAVSTSLHNSDGLSDTSSPLVLPPTVAMGYMTSDDRYYC